METNEELNRWAHRFTGRCLAGMDCECTPDDYCSSLDLAAIVEAKAIEMNRQAYFTELEKLCEYDEQAAITAPAITRVEAAKRAVEGE